VLYLGLDCSPCFKRECPFGHKNCLERITASDALSAVKMLLQRNDKQKEE
jgi:heptosyltransferase-2